MRLLNFLLKNVDKLLAGLVLQGQPDISGWPFLLVILFLLEKAIILLRAIPSLAPYSLRSKKRT